jgi:hypothetical protein
VRFQPGPFLRAGLKSLGMQIRQREVRVEPLKAEGLQVNEVKKTYTLWDFVIGIVIGALSIFVMIDSYMMPAFGGAIYARPGIVPFIVGTALMVLSIVLIVKSLRENKFSFLWKKIVELAKSGNTHRFLVLTIATLVYVGLLDLTNLHFIIVTTVFLWGVFVFFKVRILMSTILSIVTAAAIYGFFTHVFTVPMP